MQVFNQVEGIKVIVKSIIGNKVVPIIGAGFTAGCEACDGVVPNGQKMKEIMRECIKEHTNVYDDAIDEYSFKDLSDIFFDADEVPVSASLDILKRMFTNVKLPEYKIDFLHCWKYVYTINIDDAIEYNTGFKVVLPYTKLRDESIKDIKKNGYVVKLHGDAGYEIFCDKGHNIVFSSDQYISSLRHPDNANIINSIYSDYKQKNIVFIGCSLDDEPDLKVIYNEVKNDIHGSLIMQVRRNAPEGIELKRLKKHGVNAILLVNNYDTFYKELYTELRMEEARAAVSSYKYKNPKTDIISDKNNILKSISIGRKPFDDKYGIFKIPSLYIERNIAADILRDLDREHFFVIQGRRFSGKTYLINYIIQHAPAYDKFLFPSDISFDDVFIENLLESAEDSIFIFDSNSITPAIYSLLLNKKDCVVGCRNKVVIVSNTNEDFLIAKLKARYYYIKNVFNCDEVDAFNVQADRLAFVQRKEYQTNLEYSYILLKQQNMDMRDAPKDISQFTLNEQIIIFMLCVFDKVYTHEAIAMHIKVTEVKNFTKEYPLLFEYLDCEPNESYGKSVTKVVHNSRSILLNLIKEMPKENVLSVIRSIISNLYIYNKEHYKAAMMFDTLNQLFSQDGAGYLIEYIYEGLEEILYREPHFWLQRAKSIYRLFRNNKEKLLVAATYAQKAMSDSDVKGGKNINLYLKSEFSAALIYCMLYNIECEKYLKNEYQIKSIRMIHEVLLSPDYRYIPNSVRYDIITYRETACSNISSMCEEFISPENSEKYSVVVDNAIDIIKKLEQMRREHNNSLSHSL